MFMFRYLVSIITIGQRSFDLLKMQQAFWGGVEVSYRRTPGQLHLVGQSRSPVNSTARMLYSFVPIHVLYACMDI